MWNRVCWFVMHSLRNIKWNFQDAFLTKQSYHEGGIDEAFIKQFNSEVQRTYERLSKENEDV